jgi:hypothetical protein
MSISRKITISELKNFGSNETTAMPIRKLFNVGPIIEGNNTILVSSNFETAEVSKFTKKRTNLFISDDKTFPTITETYEFYNSNPSFILSDWSNFVSSNLLTNVASDHYTTLDAFFDINDAYFLGLKQSTYIANVNYEYNFYSESYENAITAVNVSEKILPNIYAIMFAKTEREVGSQQNTFDNIVTLNGVINSTETYSMQTNAFSSNKPKGEYHDLFADALNNNSVLDVSNIFGPMTNVVIPPEQLKTISQYNEFKELHPMYNEINITMDKFSSFSTLLKDSGLTLSLINYVINNTGSNVNLAVSQQEVSYFNDNLASDNEFQVENLLSNSSVSVKLNSTLAQIDVETYNIFDWWSRTKEDFTPSETNNENTLVLGIDDETKKLAQKNYEFARSLSYLVFYGKLRKLIKQTMRNFSQTINAEPAYSEAVFYRVDKFLGTSTTPIQTFWIPNNAEIDTFQYIDTQVKYNSEYRYEIYAYTLIVANSITTTKAQISDLTTQLMATLDYTTEPVVTLAKTLVYSITNKVLDDSPLEPEITFVPYNNIDNKIKILFNNSTGEQKTQFLPIYDGEETNLKQLKTMFISLPYAQTTFKSDDIPSSFQVFRMTVEPQGYFSFSDNLLTNVSTDYDAETITKAASATFIDTILPNRKYYYTFRTVDIHGNISNPTDVHIVEMVNDDGAIYLRKNILNIKNFILNKKGQKFLKKLFYIKPEIMQTMVNNSIVEKYQLKTAFDIYTLGNGNVLGNSTDSVWGKKFKLRFVSKKTGKMFDLNLQLNVEIDKENL